MIETASREVTNDWNPGMDGLVKCESCRRQVRTERGGRTLLVCSVDRVKPALVADLWRRCRDYVAKVKK